MAINKKQVGRTFFDWISEHPKTTICFGLLLCTILLFSIFYRLPFRIGNVEFGNSNNIIHDTIIKNKVDTIVINQKINENHRDIFERNNKNNKLKVRDNEIINSNQPSNINTGINNGIIGNDNKVNVVNEKPLEFNEIDQQKLIYLINEQFKKLPIENRDCIMITTLLGNQRSFKLGQIIIDYLKRKGYKFPDSNIAQGVFTDTPNGIGIFVKDGCVHIDIYFV